ncbi:hypothetical protein RHSIM_Rhsim03G0043600 [Rhododendron simsii]|uniref:Uncharacterized protein n=1 Tax=Rhododendron simsii TaxID=118357 RepID=A0A834LT77_RHOSS|nr:hypothetical protein RHSIM_Rhsim03G0043600 [Rhododendron simsii]
MGEVTTEAIKVVTSDGGIMEFNGPITVEFITDEFPGHGIFRSHDLFWKPLPHNEVLAAGESYNLLPLNSKGICGRQIAQVGHVRSNSLPQSQAAPYRMSFDGQGILKRSYTEAFSRYNGGGGIWKGGWGCRLTPPLHHRPSTPYYDRLLGRLVRSSSK